MASVAIPIGAALASVFASLFGGRQAAKAADAQVDATKYAADLQSQASKDALALMALMFDAQRSDLQPWQEAGRTGLSQLLALLSPGGGLTQGFQSPGQFRFSGQNLGDDPGFQFRVREGEKALQRSAAARGGALGGGTLRDLMAFGQDMASQEFGNAYNRAASEYDRSYNNSFNEFQANQANLFNRLASLAGLGQQATSELNAARGQYGSQYTNNTMANAQNLGQLRQAAANARASQYVGTANLWNQNMGNLFGLFGSLYGR